MIQKVGENCILVKIHKSMFFGLKAQKVYTFSEAKNGGGGGGLTSIQNQIIHSRLSQEEGGVHGKILLLVITYTHCYS